MYEHNIDVRFLDINSGNHVSSHTILDYLVDTISAFWVNKGFLLSDIDGKSYIISSTNIDFKQEIKYPNRLSACIWVESITRKSMIFKIQLKDSKNRIAVKAEVKGGLLDCYGKLSLIDDCLKERIL
ncbi:acyl-CoA thioesterase [Vibrio sagamiensis]|uniref:Uncharacterized protein n=1 Tax=Vibrio sagamiensis NBRC 104589 TaxID=1219064 RepID=A0A511QDF0_9VIBR|nr:acyl-CoA thioesterase [Vibrio sagamiensis]PNQ53822.1 acyl-CoA thioesterase [Vibrio agarivorans]GEM75328.1 hypothetical protein VSA01S_14400 [Vibrio sagamiensis NBRC 104589]